MKKVLFAMILMLVMTAVPATAASQKHRHHQQTTATSAVASKDTAQTDAIEAFSDTTSASSSAAVTTSPVVSMDDFDDDDWVDDMISSGVKDFGGGILFVFVCLFIIFVMAPVCVLCVLFYFINRNRRDKIRLAEMAIKNGQPIPDEVMRDSAVRGTDRGMMREGIKQAFLGVGLMILLGIIIGKLGMGIGALVFFIGAGKIVIAKMDQKKSDNDPFTEIHE